MVAFGLINNETEKVVCPPASKLLLEIWHTAFPTLTLQLQVDMNADDKEMYPAVKVMEKRRGESTSEGPLLISE